MPDIPDKEQGTPANPANGDTPRNYAGKYRSIEEFEKGYWDTAQEGLRQRDRALRAEAELEAYRTQSATSPAKDPLAERFAEAEIPLDALEARMEAKALKVLQDALKPFTAVTEAENRMHERFKDFPGTAELQRSLDRDVAEAYRNMLGTKPEDAMTLAYYAWKGQKPAEPERKTAREAAAQKAAESPPMRAGSPGEPDSSDNKEVYNKLLSDATWSGNWTDFLRYRFKDQGWYKDLVAQSQEQE